jgi:hypothetical protein
MSHVAGFAYRATSIRGQISPLRPAAFGRDDKGKAADLRRNDDEGSACFRPGMTRGRRVYTVFTWTGDLCHGPVFTGYLQKRTFGVRYSLWSDSVKSRD